MLVGLNYFRLFSKKTCVLFVSSEKSSTFALAFGKQRGCSAIKQDDP